MPTLSQAEYDAERKLDAGEVEDGQEETPAEPPAEEPPAEGAAFDFTLPKEAGENCGAEEGREEEENEIDPAVDVE